uniref:Uncharacterized protein n=1 Tax=Tetradesmus obliquus TaxID=3088 RepID=A0A383VI25_TETOB|eukprot:jgi/Sobl393_1/19960/SZX64590.1
MTESLSPGSVLEEAVMQALGSSSSSSSSSQRSLLQQELSSASLAAAAAEQLAASGEGFHAVLPGAAGTGDMQSIQQEGHSDAAVQTSSDRASAAIPASSALVKGVAAPVPAFAAISRGMADSTTVPKAAAVQEVDTVDVFTTNPLLALLGASQATGSVQGSSWN